ncbi:MAG TPA: hypothetical protein VN737_04180 [Bryobacteraceae bacterium]|nr:hypothetical protein [Bryobacteraceae bacterium]
MAQQTFAIVTGGRVANIISAEPDVAAQSFPQAVRIDNLNPIPGVGWTYSAGVFASPYSTAPQPFPTVFSKFGFRSLFTLSELMGIDNYASNQTLTDDQRATLNTITKNFDVSESIDVTDPATQFGVNYLASAGLISDTRAAIVLRGQGPS